MDAWCAGVQGCPWRMLGSLQHIASTEGQHDVGNADDDRVGAKLSTS